MTFLTVLRPKVSTDNSTSSVLLSGATFTGTVENVVDYATITVFVYTDTAGTLDIQFSTDGTNWDHIQTETIQASVQGEFEVPVIAKFFRIVITNTSGSNQTFLRCSSLLNPYKSDTSNIVSAINNITNGDGIVYNSALTDAFGRLKVSNPQTLLDAKFLSSTLPLRWDQSVTFSGPGSASSVFNPSYINMSVSGNGSRVVRQSRLYTPYQPGKGLAIIVTGALTTSLGGSPNVTSRMGYFDDGTDKTAEDASKQFGNGYFFQMSGSTLSVVERYYVPNLNSLPQTDNVVPQSSWNIDPMNGTGPSGLTLDPSKRQIFYIELEWLGVGTVMMGVFVNRILYFVHRFDHANLSTQGTGLYPYISAPNLPVRYEISSTGGSGSMVQICSTVLSDGGYVPIGLTHAAFRANFGANTNDDKPAVAIRLKTSNSRIILKLLQVDILGNGSGIFKIYRLQYPNSNVIDGSWVSQANSAAEYNITGTTFTLPTSYELLTVGFYNNQTRGVSIETFELFGSSVITSDIPGHSDIIVLTMTQGNSNYAALTWQELL